MAFITACVDVQSLSGVSIVPVRPDGTRSPIVLRTGPGITATAMQSGDQAVVVLSATTGAGTYTGSVTTTDGTTAMPLISVPIPTGFAGYLRFLLSVKFGGNTYAVEARKLIHNPSGTPAESTGTATPSGKTVMEIDETSGAFTGGSSVFGQTFGANVVTYTAKGMAATTMRWAMTVELLTFSE